MDYSLYEDYNLYKSNERFTKKYIYFDKFTRIYLRTDSKRTNISKEYEEISILIEGIISIFSTNFLFLSIILSYFEFYVYNSVIRKIFKFKSIKDIGSFNFI